MSKQKSDGMQILQSKDMNTTDEILHTIKKAREKFSVDLTNNANYDKFQSHYSMELRDKVNSNTMSNNTKSKDSNYMNMFQKTMIILKNRILQLEKQRDKAYQSEKKARQNANEEIQKIKAQFSHLLERELELALNKNHSSPPQDNFRTQLKNSKQKIKKHQLQIDFLKQKLCDWEYKYSQLKKRYSQIQDSYVQLDKTKQKLIEENMVLKTKLQEDIQILNNQAIKKSSLIKKIQKQNINLKQEIHNIFNKDRMQKQIVSLQKKKQDEYEFQIKEISQKYNIRIKAQDKQITLLKKTLQKLKDTAKSDQSEIDQFALYQKEIQQKREKIIQKDRKLSIKNLQIQKLNTIVEELKQIIEQKDQCIKQLIKKNSSSKLTKNSASNSQQRLNNQYKQANRKSSCRLGNKQKQFLNTQNEMFHSEKQIKKKIHKKVKFDQINSSDDQFSKRKQDSEEIIEEKNNKKINLNQMILQLKKKAVNDLKKKRTN